MSNTAPEREADEVVEEADRTFTLFPKLPIEIRLMIWSTHCAMNGRIVNIITKVSHDPEDLVGHSYDRFPEGGVSIFVSTTQVPAILHVSKEARKEASRSYKLSFPLVYRNCDIVVRPRTYFNHFTDTLSLLQNPYIHHSCDMKALRSIIVPLAPFEEDHPSNAFNVKIDTHYGFGPGLEMSVFTAIFPGLEQLHLVDEYKCDPKQARPEEVKQQILEKVISAWPRGVVKPEIRQAEDMEEVAQNLNVSLADGDRVLSVFY